MKYKLVCKNCDISFDSWFASSAEFEKLKHKKLLICHICNSNKIEKTLMAPRLINNSTDKKTDQKNINLRDINKKLKEYKKFIEKNFVNVGKNFAYEARSIHYDKRKKKKGIYGTASNYEIKELREEGINAELIPWIEDKSN